MHVHKRLEVAHCLVTHYFRLLLLWILSNDLVLNPLLAFSLFGLPNGRTDGRATYTPSGNEAAMPLMLTIPKPWPSDIDVG